MRTRAATFWRKPRTPVRQSWHAMPRVLLSAVPFSQQCASAHSINEPLQAPQTHQTHDSNTPPSPSSSSSSSSSLPSSSSPSSSSPSPPPSPRPSPMPSPRASPPPPQPFAFCERQWDLDNLSKRNNALYRRCVERLAIARLDWRPYAIKAPTLIARTQSAPALLPSSWRASPGGSTSRVVGAG